MKGSTAVRVPVTVTLLVIGRPVAASTIWYLTTGVAVLLDAGRWETITSPVFTMFLSRKDSVTTDSPGAILGNRNTTN
ncbi:hypothetical protein [Effusibacillus dendaii]|uniref:hypothetical protein n=1 Tax=Effusibacillus dendaii TaxID=2743772 RepID=UPI001909767D|nr:hypothetical protein [Effusibacillus dendaii]